MSPLGKGKLIEISMGRLACQSGMLVAGDHFAVFQEFDAFYFQSMVSGSENEPNRTPRSFSRSAEETGHSR